MSSPAAVPNAAPTAIDLLVMSREGLGFGSQPVREKLGGIEFAEMWRGVFDQMWNHPASHRAHLSLFTHELMAGALGEEGRPAPLEGVALLRHTAIKLGDNFPEAVLGAELDVAGIDEVMERSDPWVASLTERNYALRTRTAARSGWLLRVSEDWQAYGGIVYAEDPFAHDMALSDLDRAFRVADNATADIMYSAEGDLGYSITNRAHDLRRALARTLGDHFPEVVVSQLRAPAPVAS